MLIETQAGRSKSDLVNEIQQTHIAKAVIYRNASRKAWEHITKERLGAMLAPATKR